MQFNDLDYSINKKWKGFTKIAILINDKTLDENMASDEYKDLDNDEILNNSKNKINLLFKQLAEKNISLVCLNLNEEVKKMYNNLKKEYNKGKKGNSQCEFIIANYDNLSNIVIELVTKMYENKVNNI